MLSTISERLWASTANTETWCRGHSHGSTICHLIWPFSKSRRFCPVETRFSFWSTKSRNVQIVRLLTRCDSTVFPNSSMHICDIFQISAGCGSLCSGVTVDIFQPSWKRFNHSYIRGRLIHSCVSVCPALVQI